jgi:predicted Fe-Mo cluster-binding NifX family protein
MNLIIPLNKKDKENGRICYIKNIVVWAIVSIEDGRISKIIYLDNWQDYEHQIDCVVIKQESNIDIFIENNIKVLQANEHNSIDDIVEAFIFRTLHEA